MACRKSDRMLGESVETAVPLMFRFNTPDGASQPEARETVAAPNHCEAFHHRPLTTT